MLAVHAEDTWGRGGSVGWRVGEKAGDSTRSGLSCDVQRGLLGSHQYDSKPCAGFGEEGGRLRVCWSPLGRTTQTPGVHQFNTVASNVLESDASTLPRMGRRHRVGRRQVTRCGQTVSIMRRTCQRPEIAYWEIDRISTGDPVSERLLYGLVDRQCY